jgi:hypothetical protein
MKNQTTLRIAPDDLLLFFKNISQLFFPFNLLDRSSQKQHTPADQLGQPQYIPIYNRTTLSYNRKHY